MGGGVANIINIVALFFYDIKTCMLIYSMECACNPGFVYKTKSTYSSHLKSDMHKLHELETALNAAKAKIIQFELEAAQKNLVEKTLLNRILQLESEVYWYRTKFSEQSPSTQPSALETSS